MKSYNKLILEPYKPEALKSEIKHGIAMVSQKNKVVGLKLLVDADCMINQVFVSLQKGSTIYIREEMLHNHPWAKNSLKSVAIEGDFIIVDATYMEFAENPIC